MKCDRSFLHKLQQSVDAIADLLAQIGDHNASTPTSSFYHHLFDGNDDEDDDEDEEDEDGLEDEQLSNTKGVKMNDVRREIYLVDVIEHLVGAAFGASRIRQFLYDFVFC